MWPQAVRARLPCSTPSSSFGCLQILVREPFIHLTSFHYTLIPGWPVTRSTNQHNASSRSITQHHAAPHSTAQHHAAPRSTTQHHTAYPSHATHHTHPTRTQHIARTQHASSHMLIIIISIIHHHHHPSYPHLLCSHTIILMKDLSL